jgi:UDPglucose 6-dehydrogenase
VAVNDAQKARMADRVRDGLGGVLAGKRIAVLGLAFKPNTDDMREAPSLSLIAGLLKEGAAVVACDPVAQEQARVLLPEITYCTDPYEAAEGADALAIVTEWDEFRALDLSRIAATMAGNLLVDFRNIYKAEDALEAGLSYTGVGQRSVTALREVWPQAAAAMQERMRA